MKKSTLFFSALYSAFFFTIISFAQSPGNVSTDLQLWMRADQGISTSEAVDNTEVTDWEDQSTYSINAVTDGEPGPDYISESLNFNPALRFNRSDQNYLSLGQPSNLDIRTGAAISGRSDLTIFSAFKANSGNAGSVISKANGDVRDYQLWLGDTDRVVHYTLGRDNSPSYDARHWGRLNGLNEPKITRGTVNTSGLVSVVNGVEDNLVVNYGVGNGDSCNCDLLIGARRSSGNSGDGNQLTGDVSEIIIYDRELTTIEAQKVESYLAIKYGITLGYNDSYRDGTTITNIVYGGTSNDYLASNGSVLWNGVNNAGYGYNVFGIARDNNSNLLQTKSRSSNVQRLADGTLIDAILTIESDAGGLSSDLSYFLVGNNGDDLLFRTTGLPLRADSVIERIWKARESVVDPGSVKLEFDLSASTITDAEAADLDLFIADNESFNNYKNVSGTYNSTTKIITYTGINIEDTEFFTLGVPTVYNDRYHMGFDGVDDYLMANSNVLSGLSNVTVMGWIKVDPTFTGGVQSVMMGQNNLEVNIDNFGDINVEVRQDGVVINSAQYDTDGDPLVELGLWTHIAVVYNGSLNTSYLYINGVERSENTSIAPALSIDADFFTTARRANSSTRFFKGDLDEIRVFNVAFTEDQLQQTIYQEIEQNGLNLRGTIIPKDIQDRGTNAYVSWNSLLLYYSINKIRGNCLLDVSSNTYNSRFYNLPASTVELQTAPMPFETDTDGNWTTSSTWLNGSIWDIKSMSKNRDWAIVKINDNVTTNSSHKHLGLFIDANKTLTVNGDNEIANTWYLDLNGTIDLSDDSQLVQTEDSDLTVTSSGKILRRQEGQNNMFRYNYWSSPVGAQSTIANNTNFKLNMLKDINGNIQFTTGYNPANTTPATISTAWTYSFQNGVTYYDWSPLTQTSDIAPGTGYSQKGAGVGATDYQYIFEGKPNNGDIDVSVTDVGGIGNTPGTTKTEYLLGNPYASALDIHQFILDNLLVTGGEVYLWEQWAGDSHVTASYQGGYATVNLLDGVRAYQILGNLGANTGNQDGTKTPSRYIAVGQGFFTEITAVTTSVVKFRNSQRAFKKEVDANGTYDNGSTFFKTVGTNKTTNKSTSEPVVIQKIRLQYAASNNLSRELVLGFSSETTDGFDYGYDANIDAFNDNDLATLMDGDKYVMQAYAPITDDKEVDLVLNSDSNFSYAISMINTENIEDAQEIYLWDTQENMYHDLRVGDYNFTANAGENATRFKVVFSNGDSLSNYDFQVNDSALIYANNKEDKIFVTNLNQDAKAFRVINMLGQTVLTLNNVDANTLNSGVQSNNFSSGVYIIDVLLDNGSKLSKKVTLN